MQELTPSLNPEQIVHTAQLLHQLQPGWMPWDIFKEVARITVTSVIELVPLHRGKTGLEVLMTRRPVDDVFWPNQWHTPGTILRATDTGLTLASAFNRLFTEELQDTTRVGKPTFIDTLFCTNVRGTTLALVHWVELSANAPHVGQYFPITQLPNDRVQGQEILIEMAVKHFQQH
jgi:hypothetical protein